MKPDLHDLRERKIAHEHSGNDQQGRQRHESERMCKWREEQSDAKGADDEARQHEGRTCPAFDERQASGVNDVDDQRLRQQGLDELPGLE